jgi:hypothetical protein
LTGVAGYSATPQSRKLGLRAGQRISYQHTPEGWALQAPPEGLSVVPEPEPADVILAFFDEVPDLVDQLPGLGRRVYPAGAVWALWPRRAAGHRSEVTEDAIRDAALPLGLVDVKVAAVDADWSGLRLVWRRAERR